MWLVVTMLDSSGNIPRKLGGHPSRPKMWLPSVRKSCETQKVWSRLRPTLCVRVLGTCLPSV